MLHDTYNIYKLFCNEFTRRPCNTFSCNLHYHFQMLKCCQTLYRIYLHNSQSHEKRLNDLFAKIKMFMILINIKKYIKVTSRKEVSARRGLQSLKASYSSNIIFKTYRCSSSVVSSANMATFLS